MMRIFFYSLIISVASNVFASINNLECHSKQILQDSKIYEEFCYDKNQKVTYSKNCHRQNCMALNTYHSNNIIRQNSETFDRKTCPYFKGVQIILFDKDDNEYCFCAFDDLSMIDCNNLL